MDTLRIEVELPRELFIGLNVPPAEFGEKTREWVVLELFREGHISAGKAAELLGLTKAEFIALLHQRDIPYLDLDPAELTQDVAAAVAAMKLPKGE